jgi:uncharacterized membrane protein YccC
MSTLRSGIDEIQGTELRYLGDEDLRVEILEITRAMGALQAERARRVAEAERREVFSRDGHLSVSSWVAAELRTGFSEAAKEVRLARNLAEMPATKEALADGEVSQAAVGMLLSAYEAHPEEFARAEGTLVQAARTFLCEISNEQSSTGRRSWSRRPWSGRRPSGSSAEGSTCPPPSRGWSGWRRTWTPRPGRA